MLETIKCFYLTYEEWKRDYMSPPLWGLFSFLPYLWGMETMQTFHNLYKVLCFYLTYEEWKLLFDHWNSKIFRGFYLTYEEWKHVYGKDIIAHASVFTLPMRNGNYTKRQEFKRLEAFLPYLWGMETILTYDTLFDEHPRFYLTYEEWKLDREEAIIYAPMVFTLPMRNGN